MKGKLRPERKYSFWQLHAKTPGPATSAPLGVVGFPESGSPEETWRAVSAMFVTVEVTGISGNDKQASVEHPVISG